MFHYMIRRAFDQILEAEEGNEFTIRLACYEVLSMSGAVLDLISGEITEEGLEVILQEATNDVEINGLVEEYIGSDDEVNKKIMFNVDSCLNY